MPLQDANLLHSFGGLGLGKDLAYEIKALFCRRSGLNLRNKVPHGLLADEAFPSHRAIYAWWLGLKMVFNTF